MLFTTAQFALLFLPLTLLGFFVAARHSHRAAAAWLFLASLFFYGWWMPVFTLLLLASIGCNFALGLRIANDASFPGASFVIENNVTEHVLSKAKVTDKVLAFDELMSA